MKILTNSLLFVISLIIVSGCEKEADIAPENVLSPKAYVFTESQINSLTAVGPEIISARDISGSLESELRVGSIIVGDTSSVAPYGFLREVQSIEKVNGIIEIKTKPASLAQLFEKVTINYRHTISENDFERSSGFRVNFDQIDFGPKVSTDGYLQVVPTIIFDYEKNGFFDVQKLELGYQVGIQNQVKVNYRPFNREGFSGEATVFEKKLLPIRIGVPVGPFVVPVIIIPEFDVDVGYELNGPTISVVYGFGGSYYNSMYFENDIFEFKKTNSVSLTNGKIAFDEDLFTGRVYVKPELEFDFYGAGVVEPLVYSSLYAGIEVKPNTCDLITGLELGAGAEIDFLEYFGIEDEVSVSVDFPISSNNLDFCTNEDIIDTLILKSPWSLSVSIEENGDNTLATCNEIFMEFYSSGIFEKTSPDCQFGSCGFYLQQDSTGNEYLVFEELNRQFLYEYDYDSANERMTLTGVGNQARHVFEPM